MSERKVQFCARNRSQCVLAMPPSCGVVVLAACADRLVFLKRRTRSSWLALTIACPVTVLLCWLMWHKGAPTAFHKIHKPISVAMQPHKILGSLGGDYTCDDADGADRRACQIACSTPCLEPYRLCLSHDECHAIVVNPGLSIVTLKTALPPEAAAAAQVCRSRDDWRAWLAAASLSSGGGIQRPILLALHRITGDDACYSPFITRPAGPTPVQSPCVAHPALPAACLTIKQHYI